MRAQASRGARAFGVLSSLLEQRHPPSAAEIVDLSTVEPDQIQTLLEDEQRLWLERLRWDTSASGAHVLRAVGERNLAGKAVLLGSRVLAFGYYFIEERRSLVGGILVSRAPGDAEAGEAVTAALLEAAQSQPDVQRIESQFISFGLDWLPAAFRARGFQRHQREFLRQELSGLRLPPYRTSPFLIDNWSADQIDEAASILELAHAHRVDGEINELYRSRQGCSTLLQSIALNRGCGPVVRSASFVARHSPTGNPSGLVLTTEISAGHAHLAQVAVSPKAQGRGLGRQLILAALASLAREGFLSASLLVSQANDRALSLYQALGFDAVLQFPVFAWDRGPS